MTRKRCVLLICFTAIAVLPGCLTMKRGSTQVVSVDSTPPGATVRAEPGGGTIETPGKMILARRYDQLLRFEMAGYEPITIQLDRKNSVWQNVIWIHPVGWIIGAVVDLSTAAAYSFDPSSVSVQLNPKALPPAPAADRHQ